ncbi:hypothetical protein DXT63_12810 [Thermoanaerobacteraceae bacterium SP2]|nr:hypothetical protein DXT63_12810 [Thermoanaerobacteraceae bacterium SP2]
MLAPEQLGRNSSSPEPLLALKREVAFLLPEAYSRKARQSRVVPRGKLPPRPWEINFLGARGLFFTKKRARWCTK